MVPGAVLALAQTNPNDVMTNVAAWYNLIFGVNPPEWLNTPTAETVTLLASVILLSLGFVMMFWGYFSVAVNHTKDAIVSIVTRGPDWRSQTGKRATFCCEHVFVGNVSACASMLEEYVLLMSVEGSNRSGSDVEVIGVEGNIAAKVVRGHDTTADYGHLPRAVLRENYKLASASDFWIFVEQRVTKQIVDEIRSSSDRKKLFLLFEDFHIVLRRGSEVFPLQMWCGLSVYMAGDRLMSSRVEVVKPVSA